VDNGNPGASPGGESGNVTTPPSPVPGKVIASGQTWLKQEAVDSQGLLDTKKCLVKGGFEVNFLTRAVVGGHWELVLDGMPNAEACPAGFFDAGKIFVFAQHFSVVEPRQCTVAANTGANVRAEPNTRSAILGSFAKGQIFEVDGFKDGWFSTSVEGQVGFVSASILEEPCKSKSSLAP
jgi:hypothetical protein